MGHLEKNGAKHQLRVTWPNRLHSGMAQGLGCAMNVRATEPQAEAGQLRLGGRVTPAEYNGATILVKRVLDTVICVLALPIILVVALPIMLLNALDGSSPLYAQRRIGRNGRPFQCFKFRTMVPDADAKLQALLDRDPEARAEWAATHKLKCDPRVTWIGRFLRKTSLDELAQVVNVLRGEMSLVGPRPVVEEELAHYGDQVTFYLACVPGITGLWQISGRNDVCYATRVALDRRYVENWSPLLELRIVLLTPLAVLKSKGAY